MGKAGSEGSGEGGFPGLANIESIEMSLFDLDNEIDETTNVATSYPRVVTRLEKYADEMRKDLGDGDVAGPGRRPIGR